MARPNLAPLVLVLLAGCSESSTGSPSASARPPSTANVAASGSAEAAASASAAPGAKPKASAAAPAKKDKESVVKHLTEGRKLAAKKDWNGAMTEFEAALFTSPKDARVLGELGWAALQAGDLKKAKDANKRALAVASSPSLRAQVLYNTGRVAEEEKDKEAAKAAYAESLGLRDNKEVAKRFESVGGKSDEIARGFSTCTDGFDSVKDLCACLVKKAPDFMILPDAPKCEADASASPGQAKLLGDPRLSVLHMRGDEGREDTLVLASKDGKKLRAVAVLGTSYEPGAFGVHNEHSVTGADAKKVGARSIVVVHHLQDDNDSNMAGLEFCKNKVEHDTVCVLGDGEAATRCPIDIPLTTSSGCGPGVEPDPADLSDDEKAMIKQIKDASKTVEAKTSYSIGEDGKITVRLESGDKAALPPRTIGDFVLFTK